jgi:membrane protease YdiL (CAAX protease family)
LYDNRGVRAVDPRTVPAWHPTALVALMLLVSAAGSVLSARHSTLAEPHGPLILRAYLPLLLVSWGLLLYVCRVGRPRFVFGELVRSGVYTPSRLLSDVALGCCAGAALIAGEVGWQSAFGSARNAAAAALLPSTSLERAVWCVVALSAGVSEELVYRGYLALELTRFTGSRAVGVLGQALLFALAHGEQGSGAMLRFFVYAVGFGVLARARRSLVPGMLAHVGVDLIAGLGH